MLTWPIACWRSEAQEEQKKEMSWDRHQTLEIVWMTGKRLTDACVSHSFCFFIIRSWPLLLFFFLYNHVGDAKGILLPSKCQKYLKFVCYVNLRGYPYIHKYGSIDCESSFTAITKTLVQIGMQLFINLFFFLSLFLLWKWKRQQKTQLFIYFSTNINGIRVCCDPITSINLIFSFFTMRIWKETRWTTFTSSRTQREIEQMRSRVSERWKALCFIHNSISSNYQRNNKKKWTRYTRLLLFCWKYEKEFFLTYYQLLLFKLKSVTTIEFLYHGDRVTKLLINGTKNVKKKIWFGVKRRLTVNTIANNNKRLRNEWGNIE